jgi:hypothetical protein
MRIPSGGTLTELHAATKRPVFFILAEFRSGPVRLWTGNEKVIWQGQEWSGLAGARGSSTLQMEMGDEAAAVEATGMKFILSGVPSDLLGYCQDEMSIAKACQVWLGFLNESGALAGDPLQVFKGRLDASGISEDARTGTGRITITAESELRRLLIPNLRLLTTEDQQTDFPNDTFFRNMSAAANWKGRWGRRDVVIAGYGGGTTGGVPKWKEDSE